MGPHFSRTGRGVKRLKYKPYDDACIVMSQIVIKIIILLLKLFNPRQLIFIFNLNPLFGASIARVYCLNNLEFTLNEDAFTPL